jgi:hypothetical protein
MEVEVGQKPNGQIVPLVVLLPSLAMQVHLHPLHLGGHSISLSLICSSASAFRFRTVWASDPIYQKRYKFLLLTVTGNERASQRKGQSSLAPTTAQPAMLPTHACSLQVCSHACCSSSSETTLLRYITNGTILQQNIKGLFGSLEALGSHGAQFFCSFDFMVSPALLHRTVLKTVFCLHPQKRPK